MAILQACALVDPAEITRGILSNLLANYMWKTDHIITQALIPSHVTYKFGNLRAKSSCW